MPKSNKKKFIISKQKALEDTEIKNNLKTQGIESDDILPHQLQILILYEID